MNSMFMIGLMIQGGYFKARFVNDYHGLRAQYVIVGECTDYEAHLNTMPNGKFYGYVFNCNKVEYPNYSFTRKYEYND